MFVLGPFVNFANSGLASMENVGRISPARQALERLATNVARLGGSEVTGGGVSPSVHVAR